MEQLIREFPDQIRDALQRADQHALRPAKPVRRIVAAGMGGSGIGANLLASLMPLRVPIHAIQDYRLPDWAGPDTLVLASSYSGNTEETLSLVEQGHRAGCALAAVSTGGALTERASEWGFDVLAAPSGRPPRSTLAYSIVLQLHILHHAGLTAEDHRPHLLRCADFLEEQQNALRDQAKEHARLLVDRTPVLYSAGDWSPVLKRWCQQIQENAKMLCWMNVLPEMTHNEIVGWQTDRQDLAVMFFRSPMDFGRTAARLEWTQRMVSKRCDRVISMPAVGVDRWENAFGWVHSGDWLSLELAALRGVDPVEIKVIDDLKAALSDNV